MFAAWTESGQYLWRTKNSSGTWVKYITLNKEEVFNGMLIYHDKRIDSKWSMVLPQVYKHLNSLNVRTSWLHTIFRSTSHLIATTSWSIIYTGLIHDLSATNSWVCSSLPFKFTATQDIRYSLPSSIDLRCVKQIDAIFIGQSHQLLCHLLGKQGVRNRKGGGCQKRVRAWCEDFLITYLSQQIKKCYSNIINNKLCF